MKFVRGADVAQLVEHSLGKGEVTSSILVISSRNTGIRDQGSGIRDQGLDWTVARKSSRLPSVRTN